MKYALRFVQLEDSIYNYARQADLRHKEAEKQVKVEASNRLVHTVKKGESLGSIAKKYNVSVSDIKKWNKMKSNTIVPGKKLVIHRSGGSASTKTSSKSSESTAKSNTTTTTTKTHTVKKGESLSSIAKKYGCSVADLKKWNNLKSNTVVVNRKLKIKIKN